MRCLGNTYCKTSKQLGQFGLVFGGVALDWILLFYCHVGFSRPGSLFLLPCRPADLSNLQGGCVLPSALVGVE